MTSQLATSEPQATTCPASALHARQPGVLIADTADVMALMLTLLKFELEQRGLKVWLALDGDAAVDLYHRHADAIDVVLIDVHLPELGGPNLLEILRVFNPAVVACFMTGRCASYPDEYLMECGAAGIFRKPFRPAEVAAFLQALASDPDATTLV